MALRAVAFGDPRAGVWGAALSLHPDLPSLAVLGPEPAAAVPVEIAVGASSGDEWRIVGDVLELSIATEVMQTETPSGDFDQLVNVRGQMRGDGVRKLDCRGCRSERADVVEPGRFQLVRDACAWFGPGEGFALVAVRPRRASGHGDEAVSATIFSAGHTLLVAEPRLSTSYSEQGQPVRATLELWLANDDEPAEPDQEEAVQYPRRAAGVGWGPAATREAGQPTPGVQPLRWRSGRRDGRGVY